METFAFASDASINLGALCGILIIPIVAQYDVTIAYSIPVAMLGTAVLLFVAWTPHYVIAKPAYKLFAQRKKRNDNDQIPLAHTFRISLLVVPFCIGTQKQTSYERLGVGFWLKFPTVFFFV